MPKDKRQYCWVRKFIYSKQILSVSKVKVSISKKPLSATLIDSLHYEQLLKWNTKTKYKSYTFRITSVEKSKILKEHNKHCTKIKFSIKVFFIKCDEIRSFLQSRKLVDSSKWPQDLIYYAHSKYNRKCPKSTIFCFSGDYDDEIPWFSISCEPPVVQCWLTP